MKTPTPNDMCSGSCGGKRENCPVPVACGWPEHEDGDKKFLNSVVFMLTMIGLIIFCARVLAWL